jgi:ATP-dependent helicase/nuclease subunit B
MIRGVYTIPAGAAFAETLARGIIRELGAEKDPLVLASATIYLPTRRAVHTLGDAFARLMRGAALLPQIHALGDAEEEDFVFDPGADDLAIPPAIEPIRRRLLLAKLVQQWAEHRRDQPSSLVQSAALARHLAHFLDEAETRHADVGRLEEIVPQSLAEHWAEVRDFLFFLRAHWPAILDAEAALDPAARRNVLLARLAGRYRERNPTESVIVAGTTGSIPATAALIETISRLPNGAIVLPALDRNLDEESWSALDAGHPQYGMKQLLASIGVQRTDVQDWPGARAASSPRVALLREVLRPAPTTDAWRALADDGTAEIAAGLEGLGIVSAAHPGEEALIIALMLREAVETPGKSAALVTPDRNLARRVISELQRWDIAIDDSAGVPLAQTPPAVFLSLLVEAAADSFSPVPLLALLKHPIAAGGMRPGAFRRHARALDHFVLRGPRPDPGLAGIAKAISAKRADKNETRLAPVLDELALWFGEVTNTLRQLADAVNAHTGDLSRIVQLHRDAAEQLAASDTEHGENRLWRGDAGEAAAEFMNELARAGADIDRFDPSAYPLLFRQFAAERAVRAAYGLHPRLAILGPLEARLQHFDLVALSGLNEGTWPASAAADPWLSRPMREALGLESPERAIGLAAHDFATLAACGEVRLTRSLKVDGTPSIESRWMQRLRQLTKGLHLEAKLEISKPLQALATFFVTPDRAPNPAPRPEPRPPLAKRPRELSVTEIETWLRDPYAIYAKHVLGLKALDPLDAEIGPMDRGSAMHAILEQFVRESSDGFLPNPVARLIAISEEIFARTGVPQSMLAIWRPRFARAARWFVEDEKRRRAGVLRSHLEIKGQASFESPGGAFVLKGRADRIDELRGGGASIIDYKTGKPPTDSQVGAFAPQLPLEGAILERGGFERIGAIAPAQLVYIRFSGDEVAGDTHVVKANAQELVAETWSKLKRWTAKFDCVETAYISRRAPFRVGNVGDYDHLARVREWSLSGWVGT